MALGTRSSTTNTPLRLAALCATWGQPCSLSAAQSPTFQHGHELHQPGECCDHALWVTEGRLVPWPCLRLWRSNTAPNQHQQDWSVLVSPAGAWLLRWHVVHGRKSLGSVCCWWYPKLLAVPQLGCRARFCKLLSVNAASSSWHGLKITESPWPFFFPFLSFYPSLQLFRPTPANHIF